MQHFQRFLYLCALIVALLNAAILMSTGKKLPYFSEDALTKCSVHGDHPKITVTQQGVSISCCCEKFQKETLAKYEKVENEVLREEIFKPPKGLR
jgi:hypothetical protein